MKRSKTSAAGVAGIAADGSPGPDELRPFALWMRAVFFLYLAFVFVSAFSNIQDSDAWMHLSHGRLIWDLKGFPEHESFVFPALEMPFLYTSWVFGLLVYLVYSVFDYAGLSVLKAAVVTAAFLVLFLDALRPRRNYAASALVLSVVAVVSQHRFVLRPDIFQMLFLSFTILALNAYMYEGKKYAFWLPLVHLLWSNMHSSVVVIHGVYAAFVAGGLIQGALNRRAGLKGVGLEGKRLKAVLALYVLSAAATFISPNLMAQLTYGPDVLSSPWWKYSVIELWAPGVAVKLVLTASIAGVLASFSFAGRRASLTHMLLVIPFAALPFQADRFVFLFAVVAGPIVARNLAEGLFRLREHLPAGRGLGAAVCGWLLLFSALTYAKVPPFGEDVLTFGPGANFSRVPVGAVRFLQENGIEGRILVPFGTGQYFIWWGYPQWTVFVDARGYIPEDLLEASQMFTSNNLLVDSLHKAYGFETIVIENPMVYYYLGGDVLGGAVAGLSNPGWRLVYWDDVSFLYLRSGGPYDDVIKRSEYRLAMPGRNRLKEDMLRAGEAREGLEAELLRAMQEGGSTHARVLLGQLYQRSGRSSESLEILGPAIESKSPFRYDALIYAARARRALGDPARSVELFDEALGVRRNLEVLLDAADASMEIQRPERAVRYLRDALGLEPLSRKTHLRLIEAMRSSGDSRGAEEASAELEAKKDLIKAAEHFERGLKAYFGQRYTEAVSEYEQAIALNPSNPKPYVNLGYILIDAGYYDRAYSVLSKALAADPDHFQTYYALGLLAKKTGDRDSSIEYFSRYVKEAPEGHYRRQARKEIDYLRASD